MAAIETIAATPMDEENFEDEEKAFLPDEPQIIELASASALSYRFWLSAGVNTGATAAIVFVNKRIFASGGLRHAQVTFAAFHFAFISVLLYTISRPSINMFSAKRVDIVQMMPLALGMIFNVVLPNTSLAYSSIQFYQIMRIFVTPSVALLNYIVSRATIPALAAFTLVPVCLGVGIVSYFDTVPTAGPQSGKTSPIGVVFAFAGVLATSIYTIWIKRYHELLNCSSMQLLFNQAPISVLLMLYIIPFSDDVTVWRTTPGSTYMLILLSGVLASLITISQFIIINEAGPVSSTVVGHFKTCCIIMLGWIYSGKSFKDGSLVGIALALGGIISYSVVMHKQSRK